MGVEAELGAGRAAVGRAEMGAPPRSALGLLVLLL